MGGVGESGGRKMETIVPEQHKEKEKINKEAIIIIIEGDIKRN